MEVQAEGRKHIDNLNASYKKALEAKPIIYIPSIKSTMRLLRGKKVRSDPQALRKKIHLLEANTQALLEKSPETDWPRVIEDQIAVLKAQARIRRPHGYELERYHCGWLACIFRSYGVKSADRHTLRKFVSEALSEAGISHPDPLKHPKLLDEWIETPVDDVDPVAMTKAAQQARDKFVP